MVTSSESVGKWEWAIEGLADTSSLSVFKKCIVVFRIRRLLAEVAGVFPLDVVLESIPAVVWRGDIEIGVWAKQTKE